MIRNERELAQVANQFIAKAGNDLKAKVEGFLEDTGIDFTDLAEILGIECEEIEKILDGKVNTLHLETFAKLLIATNHAIQIIPVQETPIREYEPRHECGQRPQRPIVRPVRPIVPPFMPIPPFFNEKNEKGVETQNVATQRKNACRRVEIEDGDGDKVDNYDNFYLSLSKDNLANIIKRNLWDSEINIETASKDELARFLANKERKLVAIKSAAENHKEVKPRQEQTRPNVNTRTHKPTTEDVFEELFNRLTKFVAENPNIARKLR